MNTKILLAITASAALLSASAWAQQYSRFNNGGGGGYGGGGYSGGGSMPTDYSILQTKSIFAKDRRPSSGITQQRYNPYGSDGTGPGGRNGRNRSPALIGILQQPEGCIALISEPRSGDVITAREGDSLPNDEGTVSHISLNSMTLAAAYGQGPREILVGQNLQGNYVDPNAAPEPAAADSGSTSQPATASDQGNSQSLPDFSAPPAGGHSMEEIRAALMARRKQQNGGK